MNSIVGSDMIVGMVVTLLVSTVVPIGAAVVMLVKFKASIRAVLAGLLGFLVMQVAIRLPILNLLSTQSWFVQFAGQNTVLYFFLLAFTAALFETFGRWITLKLMVKKDVSFVNGVAHGVGHGGVEAIVLVGFTMVNNLIIVGMMNSGQLVGTLDAATLQQITAAFSSASPVEFYMSALERLLTMVIHVSLSSLVTLGIYKKCWKLMVAAVAFHTLVDFAVPLASSGGLWASMAVLAVLTAGAVVVVLWCCKKFKQPDTLSGVDKPQEEV